jgi:hypothetical protein
MVGFVILWEKKIGGYASLSQNLHGTIGGMSHEGLFQAASPGTP